MDMQGLDARFPRLRHTLEPTPFHKLERLSKLLDIELWCKRDDLTGFGMGGNKTRKLDYLVAQALAQRVDRLISCGAMQSNFCRMAAAYAGANGLKCTLVLGGLRNRKITGNHLLSQMFGAEIRAIASEDWEQWEAEAGRIESEYIAKGEQVYRLPIGGSTPIGALGYVRCFYECIEDWKRVGLEFNHLVHASSSAGTQTGLALGKAMTGWTGGIIGIAVAKSAQQLALEVHSLMKAAAQMYEFSLPRYDVQVDDRWIGPAYGTPTAHSIEAQELFARNEGIVLDSVYTAKAAAGLIGRVREGTIPRNARVVFLHTGGVPEVFAH